MSASPSASPEPIIKPEPSRTRRQSSRQQSQESEQEQEDAIQRKRVKLEQSNGNGRHSNGNGKGKGKKRAHDSDQEEEGDDEEEEEEDQDEPNGTTGEKAQLIRDSTGYVTGSILRIACQSFLTYDNVEFKPGPALNMIIGPNGTGKSTIACAIAIGLGFNARVLGRSTKLSSYCKNDSTEECWIEIELKGFPGKPNLVIRRVLSRETNSSTFYLDGEGSSATEIKERMEDLQVQVGNLCTFLPQDRVASFAMMSHSELLRETEKAAGDVNLSSWHQMLIDEWKAQKEKQINVDTYSKKLERATTKQTEAEKEVKQFEQRRQYEEDLTVVDILAKYAKYQEVYEKSIEVKEDKNRLDNEVKELEAKNKPFKDSKQMLLEISKNSTSTQQALDKKIRSLQTSAQKKSEQLEKNSRDSGDLQEELMGLKNEEASRKKAIQKHENNIAKYEEETREGEPDEADTGDITRRIEEKKDEVSTKKGQVSELQEEIRTLRDQANHIEGDGKRVAESIEKMKQVSTQRDNHCSQKEPIGHPPTWTAVQWLRENKDKFKGKVYEPARFSIFAKTEFKGQRLNPKDEELMSIIQGPISKDAFRTFLFELREDYDFFMREMADTRGLALNASELHECRTLDGIQRAFTDETLNNLGFDALACDLLAGPEPVIAWLAMTHNLARVPVQLKRRQLDYPKIAQLSRIIKRYYTRDGSMTVRNSNYGNKVSQTESRSLDKAWILANGGLDEEKLKAAQEKVESLGAEYRQKREKIDKLATIGKEVYEQQKIVESEVKAMLEEREELRRARNVWFKAKNRLDLSRRELARELEAQKNNSSQKKRDGIARDLKKVMTKRVKLALEYKNFVLETEQLQNSAVKLHLQALQADSDHRAMEATVRQRDEELANKQQELEDIKKILKTYREDGRRLSVEAQEAIDEANAEIQTRVFARRQEGGYGLEELEAERDELNASLECMINISPAVLEAYKKRKGEITQLTTDLEEATTELDESKTIIANTKGQWLPKLQSLVNDISKRFTASFDTLGLIGEVRLAQDDDYEKWGIEIMVSFRDIREDVGDVTLHVLSGHRQSGGERALTTVTYLLALAELARAPFALVDEINQGMDQRAERNMHKMLVETTCKDDVGQYFLLTPKLLPDLVYHEKMKVLVINSGSFIPEDLSLKAMVEKRRQLNKSRGRLGRIEA